MTRTVSSLDERTEDKLEGLRRLDLERRLPALSGGDGRHIQVDGEDYLNFSSNDYLGLSSDQEVVRAAQSALEQFGAGAGGSRLICGNHPLYGRLEEALADWKGREAALVFGSGYLTSLGVLRALLTGRDHVLYDELSHRCLLEGIRLSDASSTAFDHNDVGRVADLLEDLDGADGVLLVTEGIFSMDGDRAPLEELRARTAERDAWMLVDEAHSAGIWGEEGAGLSPAVDPSVEVAMGTLSKAFGGYGGYAAGRQSTIDYLVNRATPLIYSTGLPPSVVAANLAALNRIRSRPDRRKRLREHVDEMAGWLDERGLPRPSPASQIFPLLTGDPESTLKAGERLRERGLYGVPIRHPTVPRHLGRVRVSLRADHTSEDLGRLKEAVEQLDRDGHLRRDGPWS